MSRHRLEREVQAEVEAYLPKACTKQLFEELAIRRDIERSVREGARRVDAFTWAADRFCCSYEKARNIYYKPLKHL